MLIPLEVLGETCPVCGNDSLLVFADVRITVALAPAAGKPLQFHLAETLADLTDEIMERDYEWESMEVYCRGCDAVWSEEKDSLVVDRSSSSQENRLFLHMEAGETHPDVAAKLALTALAE